MSTATWSSPIGGLAAFARKHQEAQKAGLRAAAYVVYNAVKRGLRGGYTSGDFVTGNVINSVTISPVFETLGTFAIRIGTNVPYALYWEVGFHSAWSRKYERVEIWRPAMMDTRDEQVDAFRRAYWATMRR